MTGIRLKKNVYKGPGAQSSTQGLLGEDREGRGEEGEKGTAQDWSRHKKKWYERK